MDFGDEFPGSMATVFFRNGSIFFWMLVLEWFLT